jgi:stage V sporulation protein G
MLNITDVKIRKLFPAGESQLRAIASITIDDAFAVHGIRVVEGREKPFIAMPDHKFKNGTYANVAHPINAEARAEVEKAVLEKYDEALKNGEGAPD